jgi:hypothetical protein
VRDENLKAKALAVAGESEEERKRERLSERFVVSLTHPTPPYNHPGFHGAATANIMGWLILGSMIGKCEMRRLYDCMDSSTALRTVAGSNEDIRGNDSNTNLETRWRLHGNEKAPARTILCRSKFTEKSGP